MKALPASRSLIHLAVKLVLFTLLEQGLPGAPGGRATMVRGCAR